MLSPEQLSKLSEISNPLVRRRFTVFYQLPADLQESMLAEETAGSIWNLIKEEYHLPEASISATARIIGLIFLGELPINNFILSLRNELKIDLQTAQMIAQDINQAIFQPVKESLMQVHGLKHDANQRMSANDTNINANQNAAKQNTNYQVPNTNQTPRLHQDYGGPAISNTQNNDAERKRRELLEKLKAQENNRPRNDSYQAPRPISPPQNQSPPPARPANWHIPNKNVVDLRNTKKKNGYNGFFSA